MGGTGLALIGLVALLYTPLVFGWAEHKTFGSHVVYGSLDIVGLADQLDRIYPSSVDWGGWSYGVISCGVSP